LRRTVFLLGIAALAAGCGSESVSKPASWVRPVGAYESAGCSGAGEKRGSQYVIVTTFENGTVTGNTGEFTGVPKCGDVIVYVDADKADEVRIPALRIAARVRPGKTAKLEFYAPAGTYDVRLRHAGRSLVRVVVR
jgi:hypothetical protein